MTKLQKSAEYYTKELGLAIIPVGKDKKPLIAWKEFQNRFPTNEEVRGWWERWPDANIGIITGGINNILVIDIDSPEGHDAIRPYIQEVEPPVCKTTKGKHYYFHHIPGQGNLTRFLPGVDCRGEGGYVIAPPSKVNGGPEYTWEPGRGLHQINPSPVPALLREKIASQLGYSQLGYSQLGYNIYNNNIYNNNALSYKEIVALSGPKNDVTPENNAEIERNMWPLNRNKPQQTATNATTENATKPQKTQQTATNVTKEAVTSVTNVTIPQGQRDDYLFHVANSLARSGMPAEEIRDVLIKLAAQCDPPFPLRDIDAKVKSAMQRSKSRDIGHTDMIRAWIDEGPGTFTIDQIARDLGMNDPENRHKLRTYLSRLVQEGVIHRKGKGVFVVPDNTLVRLDMTKRGDDAPLILPLGLDQFFRPMEKNIIIVAGASDAGKTALLLNIARDNIGNMPIRYFTSEMGPTELRSRIDYFEDTSLAEWGAVQFFERAERFADVLDPDGLNIIDYLEVTEEFYLVGRYIRDIFDRLNKGIAVIAIQKDKGRELGRGASMSIEKARLYLSMDHGRIKIVKCKNWVDPMKNPNGLELHFKLVKGCKFLAQGFWRRPESEDSHA